MTTADQIFFLRRQFTVQNQLHWQWYHLIQLSYFLLVDTSIFFISNLCCFCFRAKSVIFRILKVHFPLHSPLVHFRHSSIISQSLYFLCNYVIYIHLFSSICFSHLKFISIIYLVNIIIMLLGYKKTSLF